MASDDGVRSLQAAIDNACIYHAAEFDMSVAEIVGVLEICKFQGCWQLMDYDEDEEDEDTHGNNGEMK